MISNRLALVWLILGCLTYEGAERFIGLRILLGLCTVPVRKRIGRSR